MSDQDSKLDRVYVHSPTESGDGLRVLRIREEGLQVGEMHPLREGEPIKGEPLQLKKCPESDRLFDVRPMPMEDLTPPPRPGHGPPQVATPAYQRNWESIFGTRRLPN